MPDSETAKEEYSFREHVTYGNLLLKMGIGADGTGKSPLRCLLLLHSSLTLLPDQWIVVKVANIP